MPFFKCGARSVPGSPVDVRLINVSCDSAVIRFDVLAEDRKGSGEYVVHIYGGPRGDYRGHRTERVKRNRSAHTHEHTLESLIPNTKYRIEFELVNEVGAGEVARVEFETRMPPNAFDEQMQIAMKGKVQKDAKKDPVPERQPEDDARSTIAPSDTDSTDSVAEVVLALPDEHTAINSAPPGPTQNARFDIPGHNRGRPEADFSFHGSSSRNHVAVPQHTAYRHDVASSYHNPYHNDVASSSNDQYRQDFASSSRDPYRYDAASSSRDGPVAIRDTHEFNIHDGEATRRNATRPQATCVTNCALMSWLVIGYTCDRANS